MGSLGLLAWLGKRFPNSLGRITHMWFGPMPHNGESVRQYYLQWAKISFLGFLGLVAAALILGFLASRFGWIDNIYFMGPFSLAAILLPATALGKAIGSLYKASKHRHDTWILDRDGRAAAVPTRFRAALVRGPSAAGAHAGPARKTGLDVGAQPPTVKAL